MRRLLFTLAFVLGGVAMAAQGQVVFVDVEIVAGTTVCYPTRTPTGQIAIDVTGETFQCDSGTSRYVRRDLPPCPANPPTGAAPTGTTVCKRTDAAEIYGRDGAGNWANMTGSGGSVAGSSGNLQTNNAGAFGGVADSNAVAATGAVDVKILQGCRNPARYANSGTGTAGDPYLGFEDVFDSGPACVEFPPGHFAWVSSKQIQANSATDRSGRWVIRGASGGGTYIYPRVAPALKIGPATGGTQAHYGVEVSGLTFALDQDIGYSHGVLEFERVQHPHIHDIAFYGGPLLPGSSPTYNAYMGYLLELDNTYGAGSVENIHVYGRRVYLYEMDDSTTQEELDTVKFSSIICQSDLCGLTRYSAVGMHNFLYENVKYQTIISDGAHANQYDKTTFSALEAAGQTVLSVTSSAAFAADDMVLLGIGDTAELAKVSSVGAGTITVSAGTRFQHESGQPVFHGGVGFSFSGSNRLVKFDNLMVEQCGTGILSDGLSYLSVDNVLSSCKEIVRIDGPHSVVGQTTALWHAKITNAELGRVPAADTMYGLRVTSAGDSVNIRQIEFDHIERNSSSDDTLVEFQNDAGTSRNYSLAKSVGGNRVYERYFSSSLSASTPVDTVSHGGVRIAELRADGQYTANKVCLEGSTVDSTNRTCLTPVNPTAARTVTVPDASGTVCLDTGSGCGAGSGNSLQVGGTPADAGSVNFVNGSTIVPSINTSTNPDQVSWTVIANTLTDSHINATAGIAQTKLGPFANSQALADKLPDEQGSAGGFVRATGPTVTDPFLQFTGVVSKCARYDATGLLVPATGDCPTGGGGSVSSVGLALPSSMFTVSNSPVTGTGTLTGTLANQVSNSFLSGPSISGAPAQPTFRSISTLDLASAQFPGTSGSTGAVPSVTATDISLLKFLRADGTWQNPPGGLATTGTPGPGQVAVFANPATSIKGLTAFTVTDAGDVVANSVATGDPGNGLRRLDLRANISADAAQPATNVVNIYAKGTNDADYLPYFRSRTGGVARMLVDFGGDYGHFTCTAGNCAIDTGVSLNSVVLTTKFNPPSATDFPGSPSSGDTVVITDDSAVGACDSAAGSSRSLCRYNGSAWQSLGDGGSGGAGEANTASNLGGGLSNFDSKSAVDLRFNTFAAADFNLASNLLTINTGKWGDKTYVAANFQSADSDLSAIASLASNGLIVRTGTGGAVVRTLTGTSQEISVSGGDGVGGNPIVGLPSVVNMASKTNVFVPTVAQTTNDQQAASTAFVKAKVYTECITLYDAGGLADGNDIPSVFRAPAAITVTEVWAECDAGTPSINLQRDDGSPANVLSSNLTPTTGGATGTISGAEDNFADGDRLDFVMVSASTATRINVCVEYRYD